jgi:glycosyltransferase involved in cell wall biosynthesis
MKKVLFLTWDGPEVNYLEGLFLPIFEQLAEFKYEFHVIQYTWGAKKTEVEKNCAERRIRYTRINILRKPSATIGSFFTLWRSQSRVRSYIKKNKIDIIMPRSIFPLMVALKMKKSMPKLKMVFDADGLALDERIDFAAWSPKSKVYRWLRDLEYRGLLWADLTLTRTEEAKKVLYARAGAGIKESSIFLIGNGRNTEQFQIQKAASVKARKKELSIAPEDLVLIYVGSVGEQYLVPEMLAFLKYFNSKQSTKLILLTKGQNYVRTILGEFPDLEQKVILKSVSIDEVPDYINLADFGLAFRQPSFSMKAVAPIKVGEYLLCGKPVISTPGIGDTEQIFKEHNCGYIIKDFNHDQFDELCEKMKATPFQSNELRAIGMKYFSLEATVKQYHKALSSL